MSPSFIDKVRSSPPTDRRLATVIGVDPDIHTLGMACVSADVGGSLPIHFHEVRLLSLTHKPPKRSTQSAITEGMCKLLSAHQFNLVGGARLGHASGVHAAIETQVFYPKKDMERAKMVSIANAMIAIATITGRAMSVALDAGISARMVTPNVWKGTREKPADHARSAKIVGVAQVTLVTTGGDIPGSARLAALADEDEYEHALDGLGMALYAIEQLHRGTWK